MNSLIYVDHYDSFTDNLIAWLQAAPGAPAIERIAFDDAAAMAAAALDCRPLVLSPGPKSPAEAQNTLGLVTQKLGRVPILGVCLGQQVLAHLAGRPIVRSKEPRHGAVKRVFIADHQGLFAGMGASCEMAAYHSLVAEDGPWPPAWVVCGRCELGEVQAIEYRPPTGAWAFGVQFHPESFLSRESEHLRTNWYRYLLAWQEGCGQA